jgi:Zn-dependent metalloprotease
MYSKNKLQKLVSMLFIAAILLSSFQNPVVSAQGNDGLKRQINAQSGKVNFISPESGKALPASKALGTFLRPQDAAMALAKRFAPEFGIKNPERELMELKKKQSEDGRLTVRYQQKYEGIPVMGGELIVNTNERGDLYSMNGEVSPELMLQTQPKIDAAQAAETALQAMAKWYEKTPANFNVSEPELWIFDESLLKPSNRPAELVWRMEATPKEVGMPVRELVLINAERGNISLHFNQVDTAWGFQNLSTRSYENTSQTPSLSETRPVYFELALDEARGWIYGSDSAGNKIDVISTTTLQLVKNITLASGASPRGIALSPDGSELVIAQSGAGSIIFINPDTNATITTIIPNVTIGPNIPWDVIYGRSGRLYSTGNPDSGGFDYIHVINTTTHLEINKSTHIVRSAPRLSISADKNSLYANSANFSPQELYKYDVSTDTILNPTNVTGSGFAAVVHIVDPASGYIFTNTGQVWPADLSAQIDSTGTTGEVMPIPSKNLVAVAASSLNSVVFISTSTFNIVASSTLQGPMGALVALSDGSKLFVSTNTGIYLLNLNPSLPSIIMVDNGSNQSTQTQTQFQLPLKVKVQNYLNQPMAGLTVTFTAPASGTSGTFAGTNTNIATAVTDANGIATSPMFSANAAQGGYIVQATVGGLASFASFGMTNANALVNTYTANNTTSLPGTLLCTQTNSNCTGGTNPHVDAAHKYAIGTYALYIGKHNRNSIDNAGMIIKSTVHYSSGYNNAFWDGTQAVFGDGSGWPLADDVVAHELTHGVTERESNLYYYYQSGAINESLSDLWGEYYDQTNGQGTDTADVKWLVSEDIAPGGTGAIRSMSDPTLYGDPDRMSHGYYYSGDGDNGGVHYNSAINNKAVYLMVDGGTFNGKTVTALGWDKTAAIYYEVNTNLLSSGSDYSDLYYALQEACKDLTGQYEITSGDCDQIKNALDAVEMSAPAYGGFYPAAPACGSDTAPTPLFQDAFESGTGQWDILGSGQWYLDDWYATSSTHMMWGSDYYGSSDSQLTMKSGVYLPPGPSYYLHFRHAFLFEYDSIYYDGGVLEYSTNNGATWLDAIPLFSAGKNYNGTLYNSPGSSNALKGRTAFVGDSHGYVSSQYNLSSLVGQTVKFRWRFATDQYVGFQGWVLDDVQIYKCDPHISGNAGAPGVALSYTDGTPKVVYSDARGKYSLPVSSGWSGTVTPSRAGLTFNPPNRSYSNVTTNRTDQDYTASVTITGNVGIAGVTLNYTGGSTIADGSGNYTITVPYGWSGTVTPSLSGDAFCPGSKTYTNLATSQVTQHYAHSACPQFNAMSQWTGDYSYNAQQWRVQYHPRLLGDVDGDGDKDIVGFGFDRVLVALSNGVNGFAPMTQWTTDYSYNLQQWRVEYHPRLLGDVNGDGKDDIVGFGFDRVLVALSDGTKFLPMQQWTTDYSYNAQQWRVEYHPRVLGDVDGDGDDDIIGFGFDRVLVALSNGSSFEPMTQWTTDFSYNAQQWRVQYHPRLVGDVNGDGKDDIVGFGFDRVLVALSNGSGFEPMTQWTTDYSYNAQQWRVEYHPRLLGDVNNDGMADIVGFGYDRVLVALSNGRGFASMVQATTNFSYNAQGWRVEYHPRLLGDVTGNGKADIVGFGYDRVLVATTP